MTELARGTTRSDVGWLRDQEYAFRFVFTRTLLEVYVDDVLELSVTGDFPDGRLGFYNFSQAGVRYSAFDSTVIPEPGTATMLGLGLIGLARRARVAAR